MAALYDAADELLTFLSGVLGSPDRGYVSDTAPALDVAETERAVGSTAPAILAIEVEDMTLGAPLSGIVPVAPSASLHAVLRAWVLYPVPVLDDDGNPPQVAELEAASVETLDARLDATSAVVGALASHRLFGRCGAGFYLGCPSWGPEAGLGGFTLRLAVQL